MLFVSPADVIMQSDRIICVKRTASKMGDVNAMMSGLTQYVKMINALRTEMLESEIKAFRQATKEEGRIMGPVSPTVGDLVLIKSDVKTDYSRFGIIVELKSPTTLMIQTRFANGKKLEERPVSQVVPKLQA